MPEITFVLIIAVYGAGLWVTWMFYRALARIGEELADVKVLLRERMPRPEGLAGR